MLNSTASVAKETARPEPTWLADASNQFCRHLPPLPQDTWLATYVKSGSQCYPAEVFIVNTTTFLLLIGSALLAAFLLLRHRRQPSSRKPDISWATVKNNFRKVFTTYFNTYLHYTLFAFCRPRALKWTLLIGSLLLIELIGVFVQRKHASVVLAFGFAQMIIIFIAWSIDEIEKSKRVSDGEKLITVDFDLNAEMIFAICGLFLLIATLIFHINHVYDPPLFPKLSNNYFSYINFTLERIYSALPIVSDLFPLALTHQQQMTNDSLPHRLVAAAISAFVNIIIIGSAIRVTQIHADIMSNKDKRKAINSLRNGKCDDDFLQKTFDDFSASVLAERKEALKIFENIKKDEKIRNHNPNFITMINLFYAREIDRTPVPPPSSPAPLSWWNRFKSLF